MPINGVGWELHIVRHSVQTRTGPNGHKRVRTVGTYQVFHDGIAQFGEFMSGTVAEPKGPGANAPEGNKRRIEEGRYPVAAQDGTKYKTLNFDENPSRRPKPGFELLETDERKEVLIHPGQGFLSSDGCINPCTSLPDADENIGPARSRARTIEIIADMKAYIGPAFPRVNGKPVPNAAVVIDGEP